MTQDPSGSYRKVFYDLRPAKQVERRMIIDGLQRLAATGFPIRNYHYTGMGSIYFYDFILLHRLLGISAMTSVEIDSCIEKRVVFNRPFRAINTLIEPIGDVIPRLPADRRHLLWLDYDSRLTRDILTDVASATYRLPAGSLVLVTVDVQPEDDDTPASVLARYLEEAGLYFPPGKNESDFGMSMLSKRTIEVIENAAKHGATGRADVSVEPLFSFDYADGHRMVTWGAMIATEVERSRLARLDMVDAQYFLRSFGDEPYEIRVPRLTRKERLYLDQHMELDVAWSPEAFELSEEETRDYKEIYRYYPAYAELLA